jgi:hypothetical protein
MCSTVGTVKSIFMNQKLKQKRFLKYITDIFGSCTHPKKADEGSLVVDVRIRIRPKRSGSGIRNTRPKGSDKCRCKGK